MTLKGLSLLLGEGSKLGREKSTLMMIPYLLTSALIWQDTSRRVQRGVPKSTPPSVDRNFGLTFPLAKPRPPLPLSAPSLISLFFLFLDVEKGAMDKISQDTQNENIAFIDEDGSNGNVRIFLFNIIFLFNFLVVWEYKVILLLNLMN